MTENNMEIWNALCETDPNRTKKITGKKYKGDSINPNYVYEKLTDQFGPCGFGWGFKITKDQYNESGTGDIVHVVEIGLWYKIDDVKSELIPGKGATTFSGTYSSGPFTDEDAEKKSVTDALTKASQLIGMSADIFGGMWDDSKYVAELKQKYSGGSEAPKIEHKKEYTQATPGDKAASDNSITDPQIKKLQIEFKKANYDDLKRRDYLKSKYSVISCTELTKKQASELIKYLVEDIPIDIPNNETKANQEDGIPF